ncbi:MAG: bis(5'-nucleosyl)-tetraphosphatase (symmetrical) YqeK [Dehalococcoidia bacterium]|nr:bis(5'-nucleosyl)-tetraphosphatase (symmetrical) YqeK [Dehalococcoidia bacterium]
MTPGLRRQLEAVRAELERCPEGLVAHVRRVRAEALDLARIWDVDPVRTELAVWGHDLFRAHSPSAQLRLARETGLPVVAADEASPVLLHGPLAAHVLRERFRVIDEEALAAVRDHTLGAPTMPLLAKIVLLADKVETRKRDRDPALRPIRRLARRDLDLALLCWADWKWVHERERRWLGHPAHWQARLAWVREHHTEAALPPIRPEAALLPASENT